MNLKHKWILKVVCLPWVMANVRARTHSIGVVCAHLSARDYFLQSRVSTPAVHSEMTSREAWGLACLTIVYTVCDCATLRHRGDFKQITYYWLQAQTINVCNLLQFLCYQERKHLNCHKMITEQRKSFRWQLPLGSIKLVGEGD